jgi:predicted glycogen debranching enzyme
MTAVVPREWLEADGLGGFASGTALGLRTRRYHALLLAATTPPSGRMVLVNGLDAVLEIDGASFPLSRQRYLPDVDAPADPAPLNEFVPEPWPRWTWKIGNGELVHELFVPRDSPTVVLRWQWTGLARTMRLRVTPFLSGRDFHALQHQNGAFNFTPVVSRDRQKWTPYPGVPAIVARSNGAYTQEARWYLNFLYDEEKARGLDFAEDLAAPGRYDFDLAAGPAVLIFSTADLDRTASAADLARQFADAETKRRAAFAAPHLRSADAYLVQRGAGRTIIAGYPWFGDWGRDTFISMRGFCLATGRLDEARNILTAWSGYVSQGMLPNRFPDVGDGAEYNSVDASLWYCIAVHEYLHAAGERGAAVREQLLSAVDAILTGFTHGTRYGIAADTDGLLRCGQPGVALTWMDAKVGDWVVTPRIGKPVEVQALWLNALALSARRNAQWHFQFVRGLTAFHDRFWNEAKGCLYDVVDANHLAGAMDDRVRPNQLFALGGLPLVLVHDDRARRIMQTVEEQLWTPMGPRSLAPGEPDYAATYEGDLRKRDGSYHQGTVWPWLAGPFIEAWVRLRNHTPEAKDEARSSYLGALMDYDQVGLLHLPEIADATAPFTPRGCPFQAWSLAELIRLEYKVLAPESKPA